VHALHREQVSRGLDFDYCLMTAGTSLNRAPSDQVLREGDIVSLDSGGNYRGYIGDVCRMGVIGTPDDELVELLSFVDSVQQASRGPIGEHAPGGRVMDAANALVKGSQHEAYVHFEAHGMGLVTHEAPRVMNFDNNFLCYEACDAAAPLLPGMVLSLETTMAHPRRGFVKLEDTVIVTENGYEAVGDIGRGWNTIGAGLAA
jgi:Xaa-Pro aminopeptidase